MGIRTYKEIEELGIIAKLSASKTEKIVDRARSLGECLSFAFRFG